ncbi:NAD(P)/FAD-dependent oxidoreductase [Trinickia acidisoli]|uniref:NAD(P)/FAD-dependent oxidoreductase n=1 Tax=Trinickia acidisoli TaxID=2767482 RepID=UPI001A8D3F68|nr:FAD-dependent oxidoreductase [Trinickia acidisoli]
MNSSIASNGVVIYGGGMAGALLAKALSSTAPVTLVDPLDYFEVPMAAPRNLVRADFADQAIVPFELALPTVKHIRGKLITISPSDGLIEDRHGKQMTLKASVTVLATGSRFSNELMRGFDDSTAKRKSFYAKYSERIQSAKQIVIVGGGPIGVEVAGEIAEVYRNKKITILEAGPRILRGTTEAVAAHAMHLLQSRGITVRTNERLVEGGSAPHEVFSKPGEATTTSGARIPYDLMIWCIGGRPNTGYMRKHFASLLNEQDRVMVTPELLVVGRTTMYALGDITNLDENKMAWHIGGQVKVAAWNIRQTLLGEGDRRNMKRYRPQTGNPSMVVTMGSKAGVAHLKGVGIVKAGWFVSMVKARDMLVPKYRKELGV